MHPPGNTTLISTRQIFYLLFNLASSLTINNVPSILFYQAREEYWAALLLGLIGDLIAASMLHYIGCRFPGQSPAQIGSELFGPWLGKLVVLPFTYFFFFTAAINLFAISNFIRTAVIPGTPLLVIQICIILFAIYGAYIGLENLARVSELIGPFLLVTLIGLILISSNDIHPEYLLPLFPGDFQQMIKGSLVPLSSIAGCYVIYFMLAHSQNQLKAMPTKMLALTLSTLLILPLLALTVAHFGLPIAQSFHNPIYRLVRIIELGEFVQRVEILWLVIWISAGLTTVALELWAFITSLHSILPIGKSQIWAIPSGIILLAVTQWVFPTVDAYFRILEWAFPLSLLIFPFGFTIIIFLMALFRQSKGRPFSYRKAASSTSPPN